MIIDLGCGTGLMTRALATRGRVAIGVDPSPAMLEVARKGPNADKVQWIQGDASALGAIGADLAPMTGNVAQVFLDDEAWTSALHSLLRALRPAGRLAFDAGTPMPGSGSGLWRSHGGGIESSFCQGNELIKSK